MPDREKVIKGLECCVAYDYKCNDCPYQDDGGAEDGCYSDELKADAIALLKAQEPVVHGRWQTRESGPGEIECKCSVCKYRDFVPRNDVYWVNRKFCPNCGAKMDKRRDSE